MKRQAVCSYVSAYLVKEIINELDLVTDFSTSEDCQEGSFWVLKSSGESHSI